MDRIERVIGIFNEGLMIEDALNPDRGKAEGIALKVGLVPTETEPGKCTTIQRRILDQEHIEACIPGQPCGYQGHNVALCVSGNSIVDGDKGFGMLDGRAGEGRAGLQTWIHLQLECAECTCTRCK